MAFSSKATLTPSVGSSANGKYSPTLNVSCRKFDSVMRLVLRRAASIKPSVVAKLWRRSTIGLLKHVKLENVNE